MAFKEIKSDIWKPTAKGEERVGILIGVDPSTSYEGNNIYNFERPNPRNGEEKKFIVFGSTVLQDKMQTVKIGSLVKIVYEGTTKSKGSQQDTKLFSVFVDDEFGADSGDSE